ncbi:MAG: hypothetical protein ACJ77A_03625 [Actinomycetota bacterium]
MGRNRTAGPRALLVVGVASLALTAAACTGGGGDGSASTPPSSRPSSPAQVKIETPTNGETFKAGATIPVKVRLSGARIVRQTTKHITPTTGHLHLYVDNALVSMNYQTTNMLKGVKPGMHIMKVEFVAADHLPFEPRVITAVTFEVTK